MKFRYILPLTLFILLLFIAGFLTPHQKISVTKVFPTPTNVPTPTPHIISAEKLMSFVNDWRVSYGLNPFTNDQRLCDIASIRVKEIQKDWSHNGFYASRFCSPTTTCYLAENLSRDYRNEQDTLDGWQNSPKHLKILKADFQSSCIKCENNYCAEEFGTFF